MKTKSIQRSVHLGVIVSKVQKTRDRFLQKTIYLCFILSFYLIDWTNSFNYGLYTLEPPVNIKITKDTSLTFLSLLRRLLKKVFPSTLMTSEISLLLWKIYIAFTSRVILLVESFFWQSPNVTRYSSYEFCQSLLLSH